MIVPLPWYSGQQFDAVGNLRDWMDADVKMKFIERARCIVDQYGMIEVPGTGLKVNGRLTQGENIADNGGVKQALRVSFHFQTTKLFWRVIRVAGLKLLFRE
ncbi:unnamed protein product [Haemonchus placei]|uniref:Peptidase_M13 domain-containing protein n=1 Tax=Haemonchus placei TaxID=6290 RepID=A0A0N4X7W9_HAEPC|nr:unnamed protein product [Haemonchus placei]